MSDDHWAALVPELTVRDLDAALGVWRDVLGFRVRFARPEDGFAYLKLGAAQVMLEQDAEDQWRTAPLDRPLGRGINLQIEVPDVAALHDRVVAAGLPLFRPLRTAWYREDGMENGQAEFLLQDHDGYLLRFAQHLGQRPVGTGGGDGPEAAVQVVRPASGSAPRAVGRRPRVP